MTAQPIDFKTQNGATLAVALILLVVLTLLGISVMNVSQQELQMAGQFMTQTVAQEQAEDCLRAAQTEAATLVDTALNVRSGAFISAAGRINVANGDTEASVGNPDWWTTPGNALPCGTDGRYVIEYLCVQQLVLPEDRYTGLTHALHTVRLTARGVGGSGARVVLQVIFLRNSL
jgi:type IV pilus assembly protein PilX